MKHILVTGGCGYVGTPLTKSLLEAGYSVTVYDIQWFGNYLEHHSNLKVIKGDIRDVNKIPMDGIDVVIHLANIANDPCSEIDSKLNWEVNVLATQFLVESAVSHGVKQFIYASSGSVYGIKEEPEVTEELSLVPITDYNKTKMVSERILLSYADKICVNIIRPATVCGYSPRMRLDLTVNLLTFSALYKGKITVFGGNQTRPNIHIRDMVRVYHFFLENGFSLPGIFNAGFENLTVLEIAKMVQKYIPAEIEILDSNDPRSYRLSSTKLLSAGFEPKSTVDDGIQEIIYVYRKGNLKDERIYYNIKTMVDLVKKGEIILV
ncbi:MAG: SDR family oxidoreductase [Chthoniobacterales bacterium]|nr:SDR family oxidoreductase [Chthoniobacterales bacterium]